MPETSGSATQPTLEAAALLDADLDDLQAEARRRRAGSHGSRITFSPKVFIPLTMLCRDRCGYCTFAKAPARLGSPYLPPDDVVAIARAGRAAGCHEALFTLGEGPEDRYPVARAWLSEHGFASTVDYLDPGVPPGRRRNWPSPPRQCRSARRRGPDRAPGRRRPVRG